jgi:GGDEF domain-containing protein
LFDLTGGSDRDPVTGQSPPHHLNATIERALSMANSGRPVALVRLETPYNLKGINAELGPSGANQLMHELSGRVIKELQSRFPGLPIVGIRGSGPSIFVVVTGASSHAVDEAVKAIKSKVAAELATRLVQVPDKTMSYGDIPHPDRGRSFQGVGIAAGVVDLKRGMRPRDVLEASGKALGADLTAIGLPPSPVREGSRPLGALEIPPSIPVRPSASPASGFSNHFETRRAEFLATGKGLGIDASVLEGLWRDFAHEVDTTTGALSRRGLMPTLKLAIDRVTARPDTRAVAAFFDVGNLSGINQSLNRADADRLLKVVVRILRQEYEKTGAKLDLFRQGGDEFMVLLSGGPGLTPGVVEAAGRRAAARIQFLNTGHDLDSIPHTKFPDPARGGVSVHHVAEAVLPGSEPGSLVESAGLRIERTKKRPPSAP